MLNSVYSLSVHTHRKSLVRTISQQSIDIEKLDDNEDNEENFLIPTNNMYMVPNR